MENRRRFPRFDASFQVKYCPANDGTRFGHTVAYNISRGGLCIPALSGIAKKDAVIRMDINNNDGKNSISATGRVRWASMLKRKAPVDENAGVEFIDIAPGDLDRLIKAR